MKSNQSGGKMSALIQRQWWSSLTGNTVGACLAVASWRRRLRAEGLPPVRGRLLITALRGPTWIEWAVYAATVLRLRGWACTILYRQSQVRAMYRQPFIANFWTWATRLPELTFVDLEAVDVAPACYEKLLEVGREIAPANVAYDLHLEEEDVRADSVRYGALVTARVEEIARSGAALATILKRENFCRLLCYSGLIAESPGLLATARWHGLTTICLEGWAWRPGHMIYNLNAPAMEYNVQGWLRHDGEWNAKKESEINAYMKFLDGEVSGNSEWLNNFYRIQRERLAAELPSRVRQFLGGVEPVFLVAPNVVGDSSMLRRETIFKGQKSWLCELIDWFRARPHLKLVIRAHPAEVWMGGKCIVHMGSVANAAAGGAPNILVIDSREKLNTFSLIPFARAGLAWLSSAGVDFVVRGLPAMVAARPKYEGMGIVQEPATREDYFAQLERWAEHAERPSAEAITQGKRYLHVVFKGFSFEAGARNYRATGLHLDRMPSQAEHDQFYRILVGDEPMPDGV